LALTCSASKASSVRPDFIGGKTRAVELEVADRQASFGVRHATLR
jgi:hypothetical protein